MPGTPRIALAAALAALTVGLAACGGGDDETTSTTSTTSTTTGATGASGATGDEGPVASGGSAFIDKSTGETYDLAPDKRRGTTPPEPKAASLEEAAKAADCEVELDLKDEGNTHVPASKPVTYDTDPPTSGNHDAIPLADGAYLDPAENRYYVHSMEHGRVVIHYSPDLPEEDQLALKGLFDDDPDGMVLTPNPDMPYAVAATAWQNLMGCDEWSTETIDAVRNFRDDFRGEGPEEIPL